MSTQRARSTAEYTVSACNRAPVTDVMSSSAMANRPCDCLRPNSPLCSYQHCQWFCAGQDAVATCQERITRPTRHLPNAYEIVVTQYEQFRTGVGHFRRIFHTEGASPTNHCWCQKTRVIVVSCGIKNIRSPSFSFVTIHASDGRTDGQTELR